MKSLPPDYDDPFVVLLKEGRSRVVDPIFHEEGRGPDDFLADGWRPIGTATSRIEGWAIAAIGYHAVPMDHECRMGSRPIETPTILHRSVSFLEMADILARGEVRGRGNGFNGADGRPFVFLSSSISPRVIYQGEEIERAVAAAWTPKLEDAVTCLEAFRRRLGRTIWQRREELRRQIPDMERSRDANRRRRARHASESVPRILKHELLNGGSRSFSDAKWLDLVTAEESAELSAMWKAIQAIGNDMRSAFKDECAAEVSRRDRMTFTSAVITTKPISVGLHYSPRFGSSGMGEEDEFGLLPGQVTVDRITAVAWVKDGRIQHETTIDQARDVVEAIGSERESVASRPFP